MALAKSTETVGIQLDNMKVVFVNKDIVIKEDGKEISRRRERQVIVPSQTDKKADGSWNTVETDVSGEPQEVKDICNAAWTDEVKAAYIAQCKTNLGG
jgi:hypothetical protein|tara:strand:+ start:903 stop:1196 length:294 start_codon:yes stop_codon:yes gene_type:complete